MRKRATVAWEVVDVRRRRPSPGFNAEVLIEGHRYEFASLGPTACVEVYDHPKAWRGVPRFVGYLRADVGMRLRSILLG